jgi:hypothetical protein
LEEDGTDTFLKKDKRQNSKELSEHEGRKKLPRRKSEMKKQSTG